MLEGFIEEGMEVSIPIEEEFSFPKEVGEDWRKRVKELMEEFHISVSRFAMSLRMNRQYISSVINGSRPLEEELKERIESMLVRLNPNHALSVEVDYFRVRFPLGMEKFKEVSEEILGISFSNFESLGRGWNNYDTCFGYGMDGVILLCGSSNQEEELGILVELTGQACKRLEAHLEVEGRTWFDVFRKVAFYGGIYKRVDVAINDHYGILEVAQLKKCLEEGAYLSKFRSYEFIRSGAIKREKEGVGDTLYIGSKDSEIYFCIYEKDYEQYVKYGIPVEEAYIKTRFEMRLFEERASSFIASMLEHEEEEDGLEYVCFGVVNHYLCFLVADNKKEKRDWELDPMWGHFISKVHRNKIRLEMKPRIYSIERSVHWVKSQCMPTIRSLYRSGKLQMEKELEDGRTNYRLDKILEAESEVEYLIAKKEFEAELQKELGMEDRE